MAQGRQLQRTLGMGGAEEGRRRVERPRLFAALVALTFGAVGLAWIWGSDQALRALNLSPVVAHAVEVWKGTGWVVVMSIVLYLLMSMPLVRLVRAKEAATRARAELQESAQKLATVLDAMPVAVWIAADPECRVIEGNRVGRELLRQSETEVNLSMSAPTADRPTGFAVMSGGRALAAEELPLQVAARTGREVRNFEEELVYQDGERVSLVGDAVPLRDGEGRVIGAVGAFMDVTARERVRRDLASSRVILEQAQELGQIGSWVSDPAHHGGTLTWSKETYRIFGLGEGEFDGRVDTFFSMVHPEDREQVRRASLEAIEGKSEYAIDHRIVRPDGTVRWVHERARIERGVDGAPVRMLGVCQDITERVQAELALRESETRLRTATEAASIICWETDVTTGATAYSRDPIEFFGLDPAVREALNQGGELIIHPDDREAVLRRYAEQLGGERDVFETEFRSASLEGERWFRTTGRLVHDALGRPTRNVGATQEVTSQRRTEAALRASEEQLRLLFKSLPVPAWVFDARSLRFLAVNDAAVAAYGYSEEEFLRKTIADIRPPEDRARLVELAKGLGRGFHESGGWRHVLADGRVIDVEVTSHDLDFEGVPARVVLARDVTEARRTAAALRASEERFRHLFNALPDPAWDWDVERDTTTYSATWPEFLLYEAGTTPEEVGSWEDLLHGEDRERVLAQLNRCMTAGTDDYESEYRIRCRDGSYKWVMSRGRVVERSADGRARRMIGGLTDMTERRRAEDALRASEQKYRMVLRATSDAVWDYEPATNILRWGDNIESMFGVKIMQLEAGLEGWSSRVHPEDSAETLGSFATAIQRGDERWMAEYRFRRADGTYAVVLDRAYMQRDARGLVVRVIGAMSDISDRRHAELLMAGQARTLELLVDGAPLGRVLDEIAMILEEAEPGCRCSVLLLNPDGKTVRTAAAPNLPPAYSAAIDGISIGPAVGSCGTAMHLRSRVIVTDIETDPLWDQYKGLALKHGLRACWSEPVLGAGDEVLGSIAMYYMAARGPNARELQTIAWAARLVGLAIERRRAEDKLRRRETELRDILNAVPDLMFRMDREGRYLEHHAPNPDDLMVPAEKFLGRTAREVLPPELAQLCIVHIERVLQTGEPQIYEYQVTGRKGQRHWEVRVTHCAEEQVLLLVRDITERRRAERKLQENEQRLSLLVRQSPLAVIVWDLNFRVAEWNNAAEHIFGWSATEALGRGAEFILLESDRPRVREVWRAILESRGGQRSTNQNVTRDGRTIYCEWYNAPLVDADGRVFAVASIVDDVTEQHHAQQRQQLMMAELDHRVKNNLAAVISLAEQSGRTTTTFADFRVSFLGRVRALSRLHNALAATRWQGANLGTMVRQTLEAFGQDATSQAVVEGPRVVLPARAAQAMGMALNELCTNAIKYGALSVPGGRVEVRWSLEMPGEAESSGSDGEPARARRPGLALEWIEHGGPVVNTPTRRGFGTELIEGAISYELGGAATLRFDPSGLRCTIRIELPEDAEFDQQGVEWAG